MCSVPAGGAVAGRHRRLAAQGQPLDARLQGARRPRRLLPAKARRLEIQIAATLIVTLYV